MTRTILWSSSAGDIPANLAFTNNFTATADPAVTDDSSKGYSAGSVWINKTDGRSFLCTDATAGAAVWVQDNQSQGLATQGAPVAHDTAATMTAADLLAKIITSAPAGAINLQLPLATDLDAALPTAVANSSLDFSIIDTNGANAATVTTNTGWALVGSMVVAANSAVLFRARKTGAGAWTLYRIA